VQKVGFMNCISRTIARYRNENKVSLSVVWVNVVRRESEDRSNVGGWSTHSMGYMYHPSEFFNEIVSEGSNDARIDSSKSSIIYCLEFFEEGTFLIRKGKDCN